jgi:hypothetical protein
LELSLPRRLAAPLSDLLGAELYLPPLFLFLLPPSALVWCFLRILWNRCYFVPQHFLSLMRVLSLLLRCPHSLVHLPTLLHILACLHLSPLMLSLNLLNDRARVVLRVRRPVRNGTVARRRSPIVVVTFVVDRILRNR